VSNRQHFANFYFWRTYDQKEIDLIEERGGKLRAYECKWSLKERGLNSAAREFLAAYPGSEYTIVNPENFETFIEK
jgi:hypothetical protein